MKPVNRSDAITSVIFFTLLSILVIWYYNFLGNSFFPECEELTKIDCETVNVFFRVDGILLSLGMFVGCIASRMLKSRLKCESVLQYILMTMAIISPLLLLRVVSSVRFDVPARILLSMSIFFAASWIGSMVPHRRCDQ